MRIASLLQSFPSLLLVIYRFSPAWPAGFGPPASRAPILLSWPARPLDCVELKAFTGCSFLRAILFRLRRSSLCSLLFLPVLALSRFFFVLASLFSSSLVISGLTLLCAALRCLLRVAMPSLALPSAPPRRAAVSFLFSRSLPLSLWLIRLGLLLLDHLRLLPALVLSAGLDPGCS